MRAVSDFNYKVALASGLKHLQGGRLRQAEEQFRYLVAKFPRADGGYRGLARVQVELGDRAAAIGALRDGAAALSRSGDRTAAIDLLHEAVALDPLDLAAHRRLASAHALAGDVDAAASEYARFARAELAAGDADRARLETAYAMETLGEWPALREVADMLGVETPAPRAVRPAAPPSPPPSAAAPAPAAPAPAVDAEPVGSHAAVVEPPQVVLPAGVPETAGDAFELEARASEMLASRDARAGAVGIAAARAQLAAGQMHAASDLLLALIAAGVAVHDAERELVGITRALGRDDIAEERERLLAQVGGRG